MGVRAVFSWSYAGSVTRLARSPGDLDDDSLMHTRSDDRTEFTGSGR